MPVEVLTLFVMINSEEGMGMDCLFRSTKPIRSKLLA